jgi:hypothetical protein
MSPCRPLTIFVPHCSELLTDYRPHGDGLISYALISRSSGARPSAPHRCFPDRLAERHCRRALICTI